MITRRSRTTALFALAALAGCSGDEQGPLDVSVIGSTPELANPDQGLLAPSSAMLLAATAQGLVRFDGAGQIEPGLAIRWDVSDDGLYFTFRIDDEAGIDANDVARRLRAAIGRRSRNALKPLLGAIEEVVAVTPQVVEIRLRAPRPNLLPLLAQPELGVATTSGGTGPFRTASRRGATIVLQRPLPDDDDSEPRTDEVRLRGERAAMAIARFRDGAADAVLGGSFADLPVARAASLPPRVLRIDPAAGMFGLAIVHTEGFLADPANRRALAMAIDRDRLTRLFGLPQWRGTAALVPDRQEGLPTPARADWIIPTMTERREAARGRVAEWAAGEEAPRVRIALPDGPGSTMLFALIADDWQRIGVEAERVAIDADADLRLIDEVAPADVASWYLRRFTCDRNPVCSAEADTALAGARNAASLGERSIMLAEANRLLTETVPFIALATPLRWSLVSPELAGFQENIRAVHPLHHLRAPQR